ncbi:MAG TPA: glycoside hydrolase family 15 protein [Anaerolineales bacterium]|nr:glycoside hydrolase family 15 protein [Anaerolineales bacterium]
MTKQIESTTNRPGFWSGALFGTLIGMTTLLTYQYFSSILRRPRLMSRAVHFSEGQFETQEKLAIFIAAENIRSAIQTRHLSNYVSKEILHAGYRNFYESWARDFSFAAFGLLALELYRTVRETLEAFLWHQTADGQLPVKLHSIHVITRFLYSFFGREQPVETMLKPKYISGHGAPSLDGQGMLIIAAVTYVRKANDINFLKTHWEQLRLAMKWLELYRTDPEDALLHQGAFADWADSIARRGRVLYTNVIYWKALTEMAWAAANLDLEAETAHYSAGAEAVSRALQTQLWQPNLGYFATSDRLHQLSSDGNLLAVAWGLAKPEQAESLLKVMEEAGMAQPIPTRVVYPSYPLELIALENLLGSLPNYHTDASWLWLGAWHVIALVKTGHLDKAQQLMARITEVIVREKQVNEVHAPNGQPLSSLWYKSESPLTWNAGMIIYASHIFESERSQTGVLSLLTPGAK